MNVQRFDVFLSHSGHDSAIAERLAEKLKEVGLEPWLDKWHLTPGVRWADELAAGLRACPTCAVLIGPQGLGDWVREELHVALDRAAKDHTFRLVPILLPGLPDPFDPNTLPPFLSSRTWVDFRHGFESPHIFQDLINGIKGVPLRADIPVGLQATICPYRGLQTFDEVHAEFFFGRNGDVQRLVEKLKATRFLAVVGPSGSGKSSLVRAGLIPALRKDALSESHAWTIRVLTPGAHPLTGLAAQLLRLYPQGSMQTTLDQMHTDARTLHLAVALALAERPPAERVLSVIDQSEEMFTLCSDESERTQFLANLLYAASIPDGRCIVLLTLRADFYSKCATHQELATRMATQQFLVSPMTLDGLRQAIEEPARRVGLEFERGLVETMLDDVTSQPGALPLLEHALLELWERRRGRMLTLEAYHESGRVEGAIAQRAEAIYAELSPEQQVIVQCILLRLTQPGEGTEDTRRRAAMSELATRPAESEEVERVVNALVNARLLTTSGTDQESERWVEVSHEALIRGWPQLRAWIENDRAGLRVHRRLTEAAQEWQRLRQDDGLLYRGAHLAEALEWRQRHEAELNESERAFLAAGVAFQEQEQQTREQRRRLTIWGLTTGLVIALGLSGLAFFQWRHAQQETQRAERNLTHAVDAIDTLGSRVMYQLQSLAGVRSESLEQILNNADSIVANLLQEAGASSIVRYGAARLQIALSDIYQQRGALQRALAKAQQAQRLLEQLTQQDPTNTQWQRDLSVSHEKIGDVLVAQGDGAGALAAYRQGLAIRERLAQQDPTNTTWQRDLSVSYMKLGQVLMQQSQRAEALSYLEKAREITARLAQHDPSNAVWKSDLTWVQNRIAALRQQ